MATKIAVEANVEAEVTTQLYLLSALAKDSKKALDELTAVVEHVGSKVEKSEDLGLKRLAFPINKNLELSLVSVFFNSDTKMVKALEDELKHAETIERFILTTWRAGLDEPKKRKTDGYKRGDKAHV